MEALAWLAGAVTSLSAVGVGTWLERRRTPPPVAIPAPEPSPIRAEPSEAPPPVLTPVLPLVSALPPEDPQPDPHLRSIWHR